jgi:hypothetical protein
MDLIFDALRFNQSIKEFTFGLISNSPLHLKNVESLGFIEVNSSIKILDFSFLQFEKQEMECFEESLVKNKSITNLDLSYSNYSGSFQFLQNNILKKFSFAKIWSTKLDLKNFFENLKLNESLTILDLSFKRHHIGYKSDVGKKYPEIHKFIEMMSNFPGNVEHLILNLMSETKEMYDFHKLLKNPKLIKIELKNSFSSETVKSLANLLNGLNENNTLLSLDIGDGHISESLANLEEIQISNKTLEELNLSSFKK